MLFLMTTISPPNWVFDHNVTVDDIAADTFTIDIDIYDADNNGGSNKADLTSDRFTGLLLTINPTTMPDAWNTGGCFRFRNSAHVSAL